ncbi:hypothetical protein [Sulfurimonas sp.]|uniref:hypothetical protein n=1 Tax=Sulfurimonas sp. TaxID=2022749 RepID=UPI0026117EAC|nr:hypothetical protein [Sulfurimonas sp.]
MFWKFKGQVDTVFVDSNSASFKVDKSVNVILSPALYWVKKVSLPVKSMREVRSLLESLFEDTLPEGNYSYTAYKEGEEYLIFAYEDKKIIDILSDKGIAQGQINAVYFAQSELSNLKSPKKIDKESVLLVKDAIVVLLPAALIEADEVLDVSNLSLSKHTIRLKQFGHLVNDKSLYTIAALFLVLIILILSEYFITQAKVEKIQTQQSELFTLYKLKPTMLQNRSMLKEYEKIYKTQTKLRETLSVLLGLSLQKGHAMKLLAYKGKKLNVVFSGLKAGQEKYLITAFKRSKLQYTAKFKDQNWYVEFSL